MSVDPDMAKECICYYFRTSILLFTMVIPTFLLANDNLPVTAKGCIFHYFPINILPFVMVYFSNKL